jgi:hypothetical protein
LGGTSPLKNRNKFVIFRPAAHKLPALCGEGVQFGLRIFAGAFEDFYFVGHRILGF